MAQSPEFDIIVYGASGFTGRLVAEYIAKRNSAGAEISWAMAGRSEKKLESVRDEMGVPADTPLVVADSDDADSLDAMAKRAKVIITTVGPYQLYGDGLVAACVNNGTDYVDLCGEPVWMRQKIDQHDAAAKASGARIVFSGGFDSIPFDLGVHQLQKHCGEKFGGPAPRIKGRMRAMQGTFSGGTAASLTASMAAIGKDPSLMAYMVDPFALAGGFTGPEQPSGSKVEYDEKLNSWCAPFVMAAINTKNVHRTNALLGHPYGKDFVYDEMILTGPGDDGEKAATQLASTPMIGGEDGPKPGEGPSKEERENGFYDAVFFAEYPDGKGAVMSVKGDKDPGYGSTSKIITEAALALLETDGAGGVTTPGAALGDALVPRLTAHAGLEFTLEG